jgi:hypothetical protein
VPGTGGHDQRDAEHPGLSETELRGMKVDELRERAKEERVESADG